MPLFHRSIIAEWRQFVLQRKEQDLQKIIDDEGLKPQETRRFVENCFRNDELKTTGTAIDDIFPRISRFAKQDPTTPSRIQKKLSVIQQLREFFDIYLGLGIAHFQEEDATPAAPEEGSYLCAAEDEAPYGHTPN